jgi:hypothetical protein
MKTIIIGKKSIEKKFQQILQIIIIIIEGGMKIIIKLKI